MIRHAVFLAVRYLAASPGRTAVMVGGTTVALFLPLFTWLAAAEVNAALLARAESTPVLVGHVGNAFDQTLAALYFRSGVRDPVPYGERHAVSPYGVAVPLHVEHTVSGQPLVGTTLDYFDQRGLIVAQGRLPAVLGEVVVGAGAARDFNITVGDRVRSDMRNLYNLAGSYPLVLQVVGVLEPTGTADDGALFADVKTAWALDGILHGHEEVTRDLALNPDAAEEEGLQASSAIFMFQEISAANQASFHLHGDLDDLPVTAVLVFPTNQRAHDQLLGDTALRELVHAVRPTQVVETILGIVLRVQEGLAIYFGAVAATTAAFFGLVLSLTLRLRASELRLMRRIGCSRFAIATMVGAEVTLLVGASAVLASGLTALGLRLLQAGLATAG